MDVLTPFQGSFLKAFSKTPLNNLFYLTGGTALAAFYLEHRLSDDLGFFTNDSKAIHQVPDILKKISKELK